MAAHNDSIQPSSPSSSSYLDYSKILTASSASNTNNNYHPNMPRSNLSSTCSLNNNHHHSHNNANMIMKAKFEPQTSTPLRIPTNFIQKTAASSSSSVNYSSSGVVNTQQAQFMVEQTIKESQNSSQKGTRFLSTKAVSTLNKWFIENRDYPYPDEATTDLLAKEADISSKQVKKWFANKRVRSQLCCKPIHRYRRRTSGNLVNNKAANGSYLGGEKLDNEPNTYKSRKSHGDAGNGQTAASMQGFDWLKLNNFKLFNGGCLNSLMAASANGYYASNGNNPSLVDTKPPSNVSPPTSLSNSSSSASSSTSLVSDTNQHLTTPTNSLLQSLPPLSLFNNLKNNFLAHQQTCQPYGNAPPAPPPNPFLALNQKLSGGPSSSSSNNAFSSMILNNLSLFKSLQSYYNPLLMMNQLLTTSSSSSSPTSSTSSLSSSSTSSHNNPNNAPDNSSLLNAANNPLIKAELPDNTPYLDDHNQADYRSKRDKRSGQNKRHYKKRKPSQREPITSDDKFEQEENNCLNDDELNYADEDDSDRKSNEMDEVDVNESSSLSPYDNYEREFVDSNDNMSAPVNMVKSESIDQTDKKLSPNGGDHSPAQSSSSSSSSASSYSFSPLARTTNTSTAANSTPIPNYSIKANSCQQTFHLVKSANQDDYSSLIKSNHLLSSTQKKINFAVISTLID